MKIDDEQQLYPFLKEYFLNPTSDYTPIVAVGVELPMRDNIYILPEFLQWDIVLCFHQ